MLHNHMSRFGTQWDKYLSGAVWAYRNTPHHTKSEKPSYLLFGMNLQSPVEAELTSPFKLEPMLVSNYREELLLSLLSAKQLAVRLFKRPRESIKLIIKVKQKLIQ